MRPRRFASTAGPDSVSRVVAAALCVLAAGTLPASRARGDAVVRIRAETRIELDVRRDGSEILITGTVRDDGGDPVAARSVGVSVRPQAGPAIHAEPAQTDRDGRFVARVSAPEDGYLIDATFDGDADLVGTSARVTLDPVRSHVVLVVELEGGNRLCLDSDSHALAVSAASSVGGGGLSIEITNEIGGAVASGRTGVDGRLELALPSASLGPPAAGRLVVRTAGDGARTAAQTEVPIVRYRETELAWLDDAGEIDESTVLRGRLTTAEGPLERRAVGIFVDGEHLGTRLTGADGDLSIPLDPAVAGERDVVRIEARFDADAPWLASSVSPARSLAVRRELRVVPLLAVASGLFVLLAAWWLRRRPVAGASVARPSTLPGVMGARPAVLLPLIRGISGVVIHAASREVIRGATVRCGPSTAQTAADGSFGLEVPDGAHVLHVEAPGFEDARQRVSSPHRGEWRGARVSLESRRDLAHRALHDVLAVVLPREAASVATDRELLAVARDRGAAWPEIVELADVVERLVYGEAAPEPADLDRVRSLARRARGAVAARVDSASGASL